MELQAHCKWYNDAEDSGNDCSGELQTATYYDSVRLLGVHGRVTMKDPILEEIHRIRDEYSARFPTIEAMGKHLRQREALSRARGVKFVAPPKNNKRTKRKTAPKKVG